LNIWKIIAGTSRTLDLTKSERSEKSGAPLDASCRVIKQQEEEEPEEEEEEEQKEEKEEEEEED
jgi:hypothetical protein